MENLTELESYSTSRFIDPTLVRLPTFECSVRSDGVSIRRGDQLLNYTLKSPHKPGTELMAVNSHSGITFYLKSEYESYREAKRKESQAQQAASQ